MKRWELVSRDVNGRVIGVDRFRFRRNAERLKRWHDATACGGHSFLTPLPEGMPPLFTNEVRPARIDGSGEAT